jgi:copper(I)-binding protein
MLRLFLVLVFIIKPVQSYGQDLEVKNAWIRATLAGQRVAAGFATIQNARGLSLVEVSSPAAQTVEMHHMFMEHGVMNMRKMDRVDADANGMITFEPSGQHIMLIGINHPMQAGEKVVLTMTFVSNIVPYDRVPVNVEFSIINGAHAQKWHHD